MASTLQKQLAAIAANSTHELDIKAQKTAYSKSLLFEPKQATAQTYETIHQIGLQGLRDLCAIESRFQDFRDTLFSQHSISHDRAQLLPAGAQDLDRVIEKFLSLVSSRLLLRPAIKALEWLVRRYRIHEHNTDFLILTFLPYHTTPLFRTLLSILPTQLPPHLRFLHPYVTSLANPPRTALVQTAVHDKNFFSAFNNHVLDRAAAHHQYTGLVTLWAGVVVQSIEFRLQSSQSGRQNVEAQKQQDLLTQVLPILDRALSIPKAPELALGSYMIVLVLSGKLDLEDSVLDAFIQAIAKNWTTETVDAGLGCIAAVAERKHATRLPRRSIQTILRVNNLAVQLGRLSQHQSVEKLVLGLLSGAIESLSTAKPVELDSNEILSSIVQTTRLGPGSIQRLTRLVELEPVENSKGALLDFRRALTAAAAEFEAEVKALPMADGDEAMADAEDAELVAGQVDQHQLDTCLRKVPAAAFKGSFLAPERDSVFAPLASAFNIAHQDAQATVQCLASPALAGSELAYSSFLVRVAISDLRASVRRKAAHVLAQRLAEQSKAESACDYQSLVPYLLVLYMDQDSKVRQSATRLVTIVHAAMRACVDSSKYVQWDQPEMYAVDNRRISVKLASGFLEKTAVACAEECVVDCNYLVQVVRSTLDDMAAHSNKASKRFKGEERKQLFDWLSSHAQHTGSLGAKKRLLDVLNRVDKAGGLYRSKYLLPTLQAWSALDTVGAVSMSSESNVSLDAVDKAVLEIIHPIDGAALEQLSAVAKSAPRDALSRAAFGRIAGIWPFLKLDGQLVLARFLLDSQSSSLDDKASAARETLSAVQIWAEVYTNLIKDMLAHLETVEPASKRRRTSEKHDPQLLAQQTASLARLTVVLDLLDGPESLADLELFYTLFRALQALQDIKSRQGSNSSYAIELTLSILSSMAKGVDQITAGQQLDSSIVRTDLLVDCVRASSNAQVRNSAMILLAHLAKQVPQKVLHTVMPIFTLMSSSSATQGDEFTIHVVDQTIQQVVPLMADSLRSENKDVVSATAQITLSFASAFEHIPSARRLHLFTLLVNALGPEDALFAILAALKDHAPDNLQLVGFAVRLMQQFPAPVCMTTVVKYLGLCLDYFSPSKSLYRVFVKSDVASTDPAEGLARLLALLGSIVKDSNLQARVRASPEGSQIRASFTKALEHTIKLSQLSAEEERVNAACPKVLEGLLSLLPFPEFIQAAQPLLDSTDSDLCRSVVRALEFQVRSGVKLDAKAKAAALDCIPRLVRILQDSSSLPLQHSTVACLDRICDKFGKIGQHATLQAAHAVSSTGCVLGDDDTLRTLSLHCLATTIEKLGNEFIPLLQSSIAAASDSLDRSIRVREVSLHNAAYAVLIAIVEHVPFVVSAKAMRPVFCLTQASVQARLGQEADETRQHFLQAAATTLDMPVLCDVSLLVWNSAIESGYSSVQELIGLIASAIDQRGKSVVAKSVRGLFKFFLQAFDVRTGVASLGKGGAYDESQTADIENVIIKALLALVFKINDTTFRPFFTQLFEWSTEGSHREPRSLTFFHFMLQLSERLKSLVTSYFGTIVDRAAEILDTSRPDAGQQALRVAVLQALRSSFTHDEADFWQSPSRFQAIMAPLLAQLPALPLATASSEVVPTVTELAACANSADNLKEINWQLLAQFRSESAKTRLAAVRCQHSLTDSLGEDWLGLLPEMLPLISELQEDDDERVERETHKWIKAIEGQLGESLDAMLQ